MFRFLELPVGTRVSFRGHAVPPWMIATIMVWIVPLAVPCSAATLSGTKTIGPTGNYASIGAAVADIQTHGLGGALVLELQSTYISSVESFPLTFTNLTGASVTNTVTLRPQTGATNLSIVSADATATINLDNGSFITFDVAGRAAWVPPSSWRLQTRTHLARRSGSSTRPRATRSNL